MCLQQVLLTDSGLPISSAQASKFNTALSLCERPAEEQSFFFAAQIMVSGNEVRKKESLLVPLLVKTY